MIKIKIKKFLQAAPDPLDEGRVDDLKMKYPGKDDIIDQLAAAPGNNKYLDWMMKHFEEADNAEEMLKTISDFHKKLPQIEKKDINQYESFDDLAWTVKNTKEPTRELERRGTLKLYEDDKCIVYRPLNREASCDLGATAQWCISSTKSENYFNQYAEEGVQHFFIRSKTLPKSDPKHMIAYSFSGESDLEIHDAEDESLERSDVSDVYGEELERKIFILTIKHYHESGIKSEIEPFFDTSTTESIKELVSSKPIDERMLRRKILRMFGMDRLYPGEKDNGDMMTNPDYNEKNIRALLDLNNSTLNKILYRVIKEYNQIQEYIPKRLVKKILDFRQPNQDFQLSESKILIKLR